MTCDNRSVYHREEIISMSMRFNSIEQFEVARSHFEVGFAIGRRFAVRIGRLLDSYPLFQQHICEL